MGYGVVVAKDENAPTLVKNINSNGNWSWN